MKPNIEIIIKRYVLHKYAKAYIHTYACLQVQVRTHITI